eukprot:CAMPEP_0117479896 /NCGR_PEP_ID=MMETSP0784-20121206/12118_1 /TAXON_ID=39447 /ORGANISM="" /LENGTH=420 /DNA_ID=CAMNT_0005274331 /DNA_START=37 /DNA_END=1296 /DNA_ORIENTATION=+
MTSFWVSVLLTGALNNFGRAAFVRGNTRVIANSISFLTKFCFDYNVDRKAPAGMLNITLRVSSPIGDRDVLLAFYDDQASSYPDVAGTWADASCAEKLRHARFTRSVPAAAASPGGFSLEEPIHEHIRPRWWYVAIADCSGAEFGVDYEAHMWNPLRGWQSELSIDRRDMVTVSGISFLVLACVALTQSYANSINTHTATHPMLRVLTAAALSAAGSAGLLLLHYMSIAFLSQNVQLLYLAAKLVQVTSKFLLMSILLFISRGKCVSHALCKQEVLDMFKLFGPFCLGCFALELWGEDAESRKYTTDFVYTTHVGMCLILFDMLCFGAYAYNFCGTYAAERNGAKRLFYRAWGVACSIWFLVLPGVTMLSRMLAPWVRAEVVAGVLSGVQSLVLAALVAGMWPTRVGSQFTFDEVELCQV